MAAMVHGAVQGRPRSAHGVPSSLQTGAKRMIARSHGGRVHARRHSSLAIRFAPLLLDFPGHLESRKVFCAAVVAWGAALALSLGWFEVALW